MLTTIPFHGFYESCHDAELTQALESIFQDDTGDCVSNGLLERAYFATDWKAVHLAYAKKFTECFAHEHDLPLTFESMQSPREYNFSTDRIFAEISVDDARKILADVDQEAFRKNAADSFTSRSGFYSFYNPDVDTWGDIETWDHNQIGCLIEAYTGPHDHYHQCEVMESPRCNSVIENMILENMKDSARLLKIADYLRERKSR